MISLSLVVTVSSTIIMLQTNTTYYHYNKLLSSLVLAFANHCEI